MWSEKLCGAGFGEGGARERGRLGAHRAPPGACRSAFAPAGRLAGTQRPRRAPCSRARRAPRPGRGSGAGAGRRRCAPAARKQASLRRAPRSARRCRAVSGVRDARGGCGARRSFRSAHTLERAAVVLARHPGRARSHRVEEGFERVRAFGFNDCASQRRRSRDRQKSSANRLSSSPSSPATSSARSRSSSRPANAHCRREHHLWDEERVGRLGRAKRRRLDALNTAAHLFDA